MQVKKCSECGQYTIPWDDFPTTLRATVSCSNGVQTFVNPNTESLVHVGLWLKTLKELIVK